MATPDQLGDNPVLEMEMPPGTDPEEMMSMSQEELEESEEGLITEPVLGIRMLMPSRVHVCVCTCRL